MDHNDNLPKEVKKRREQGERKKQNYIPVFVQKTYAMINECDPNIAKWTTDGAMFVVKDPSQFGARVMPAYFDTNKFESFVRQLNFYGFKKVQVDLVRIADIDKSKKNHVIFCNENFKRDRTDLLINIVRCTRGKVNDDGLQQQTLINSLKQQVVSYERQVAQLTATMTLMENNFLALTAQQNLNRPGHVQSCKREVELDQSYSTANPKAKIYVEETSSLSRGISSLSNASDIVASCLRDCPDIHRAIFDF